MPTSLLARCLTPQMTLITGTLRKYFQKINKGKTEVMVIGSKTQRKDMFVYLDFLSVNNKNRVKY